MPFQLSAKSRERLKGVHPDLRRVVERAIELSTQDFTVHEGVRTIATQRRYVARGDSQTMDSRHLQGTDGFGHAVDLVPWVGGAPRWEWPLIWPIAEAMRVACRELDVPIRWGGGWFLLSEMDSAADTKQNADAYVARKVAAGKKAFMDGPHYELPADRYPA